MALSIMTCDVARNPFSGEGSTVSRISGASTSVDVIRRTVVVAVSGLRVRGAYKPQYGTREKAGAMSRGCSSIYGVCQRSCPLISCGVSDFRDADFVFGIEPDRSGGLPVAGFA